MTTDVNAPKDFSRPAGRLGSPHCARTMMLAELEALLAAVPDGEAARAVYRACVEEENCLAKRSCNTRQITFTQLQRLYGLDPSIPAFRALRLLWEKDAASRPLLALLCACARDPLLREAAPFILRHKPGAEVSARAVADFLEKENPGRFSPATLHSASRNLRSTFTQSGHLQGRSRKTRVRGRATPAAAAYALYLGRLEGLGGGELLQTVFTALLDCDAEEAFDLAQTAAQRGWLDLKRVGDIVEIEFPNWPCPNGRYPNGVDR